MIASNVVLIGVIAIAVGGIAIYILYSILFASGTSKGDDFQLSTKQIIEQVDVLFEKKEYTLLEVIATQYLKRAPNHVEVRIYLAKAFYEDKKYNQAIQHCGIILQKRPNDVDTHLVLAKCYVKKQFYNKAVQEFEYVYERRKKDKTVLYSLAKLYRETDQLYMAIGAYGELVELTDEPDEIANLQSTLAELNEEAHDYPAAFEAYKARLSIYPKDVDTNKKLAELYIKISNYPIAIETLLYMLSFVTDQKVLLWIFEMLVDLYEETNDYEKAIAYAEKLLDLPGSDKFKIRDRIAAFNLKLNRVEDGILILEDLAMLSQNGYEVTVELANAYIHNGEYQKALDKYLVLLDKSTPKEAKAVNTLICELYTKWSEVATEEKDYERALELLRNASQYNAINPEVYYHVAYNNFLQKNYTGAVDALGKALEYDKEKVSHPKCYLLLSESHHELGNFFEEKKALTDLLNLDEKNPEGLYRVGLLYAAQHDIKNAEEAFRKAIAYDPDMVQAKYNLALLYENNNRDKARELYMEVLEQDPSFVEAKNALADLSSTDSF